MQIRGMSEQSEVATDWRFFDRPLTGDVGELVLQGADIGHVYVEKRTKLGHGHADPWDGDVGQAAAAVHWVRRQRKEQNDA